ncbi:MAG: hypothetical protein LLG05_18905 [Porphyromonadaceae bacterium]|nr:hypothetical protein [Porphyromonadaceae bacterium]
MGLDITAYRQLSVVEDPKFDEDGDLIDWESQWRPGAGMVWSETHFPGRGEGIIPETVYSWEEEFDFGAGSYFGYNSWRRKLNDFMGDKAFQELINFADNEGVIGPVVSKKIAKDFADYEEQATDYAETMGTDGRWWISKYQDWKKAFEMASDDGAIDFH